MSNYSWTGCLITNLSQILIQDTISKLRGWNNPHLLVLSVSIRLLTDSNQVPVLQTNVFLQDRHHRHFQVFSGGRVSQNLPLQILTLCCHRYACSTPDNLIQHHGSLLPVDWRLLVQIQEVIWQQVNVAIVTLTKEEEKLFVVLLGETNNILSKKCS